MREDPEERTVGQHEPAGPQPAPEPEPDDDDGDDTEPAPKKGGRSSLSS